MANNHESLPKLCWLKPKDVKIPEMRLHSRFEDSMSFKESIEENGVIQPIYVFEDDDGNKWLADGQNRLETAKELGENLIQAYVLHGSEKDAMLYSVKLNVLRGKVNLGELAEFLANVKASFGWTVEKIASELHLSKGYVSKLLSIAENPVVLEKLKNGLLSYKEAYNEVLSFPGKQELKDTGQPLTDSGLTATSNLKDAMEEGERFIPLVEDDLKPEASESKKTEYMTCDFCGKILSRIDVRWIRVHADEYDRVLLLIKSEAEREAQNELSQPER
ncbi:MAG: ParB/RepB/Spo0J family partition protein [Candidatus Bathyarchaeia archaeon]